MNRVSRARRDLAVLFFAFGLVLTTWLSRIPGIKEALHLTNGQLSLLLVASPLGAFAALQVVPRAVNRWTSRLVARWTIVLACGALVVIGLLPSVFVIGAALFCLGLLLAADDMALNTQGVAIERAVGRPILSGLHGIYSLGTLTGPLLGALAVRLGVSPGLHFSIIAAGATILGLTCTRSLFGAGADLPPTNPDSSAELSRHAPWQEPVLVLLGIVGCGSFFVEGTTDNWSGVYLRETLDSSLAAAPLASAAFALGMTVGRFCGDALISRWGRGGTMAATALLAAGGGVICVAAGSTRTAVGGFALLGLGSGPIIPIAFGIAGNLARIEPARAIAWVTTIGYIGFVAAPPLIGSVAEAAGMRLALAVMVPLLVLVAVIGGRLRRDEGPPLGSRSQTPLGH